MRKYRGKGTEQPRQLLERGKMHLEYLVSSPLENELLHGEHIKAAHEYGRVLEYYLLALEAEDQLTEPAA
jgi:hypothetical protein